MSNSLMSLKDFYEKHLQLGGNDIILDVRNPEEYQEAHIKGAINLPISILNQHVSDLKKYTRVYIHCKKGGRAQNAYNLLSELGLNNLVCISDAGMEMWINEGYPTEKG